MSARSRKTQAGINPPKTALNKIDGSIESQLRATYRLQLRKEFTFQDATKITSYLDDLGISHLYLSPILEAAPGSNHGYDGTNPTKISEERGGEAAFDRLAREVEKSRSINGIILDIVPNHVAASWRTPAWWEALKNGPESPHWRTFDFRPRNGNDTRVVLPKLGRSRQAILAARELYLTIDGGQLVLKYYDSFFPVNARSYARILRALAIELKESSAKGAAWRKAVLKFADRFAGSPHATEKAFSKWLNTNPVAARVLSVSLRLLPLKLLEETLDEQHYALEDWRAGSREINYRRFFDINDLAAIRIEDEKTFKWAHSKVVQLMKKYPLIHGLRIDHVDGLTDPEGYLNRLSRLSKNVWVEKILGDGEQIPKSWAIRGTTGYEYLGISARLFVQLPGLMHLHSHYTMHVDHRWQRFHDCVYDSKREMLDSHFVSEMNYLTDQLYTLANTGRKGAGFTREELKAALRELTSSLRVYRTYFDKRGSKFTSGNHWLKEAFAEVEGRGRLAAKAPLEWLRTILFSAGDWSESTIATIRRWEQLTGPVMAKGLEDTALYRYFPLLSLNIVGGEPDWVGDGAVEYHAFNQERLRTLPLTINTSSTHDTKRAEDVRARIHVLSELSEEWTELFARWHKRHMKVRKHGDREIPEISVEYMIYETLLGAWPYDGKPTPEFAERMKAYFMKAVREGKSETSWTEPDATYEEGVKAFVDHILFPKDKAGRDFLKEFNEFQVRCSYFGAFNSLSNLALKVFAPGVPDFYQGTELWDLSLVDPDNRRPVDYELRASMLKNMARELKRDPKSYFKSITKNWKSGEVKLWLVRELLRIRNTDPLLFTKGDYYSIEPKGEGRPNFVSFVRKLEDRWVMVIVPRFLAGRTEMDSKLAITDRKILATTFALPPHAPKEWTHAFTGESLTADKMTAGDCLQGLPVAVLTAQE